MFIFNTYLIHLRIRLSKELVIIIIERGFNNIQSFLVSRWSHQIVQHRDSARGIKTFHINLSDQWLLVKILLIRNNYKHVKLLIIAINNNNIDERKAIHKYKK